MKLRCQAPVRSAETIRENCLYGYAGQVALMECLQDLGYNIRLARYKDWWYDLILEINGTVYLIDVKYKFSDNNKYYEQSLKEMEHVNRLGIEVLYMCVNATDLDRGFVHVGEQYHSKLESSKLNKGGYIYEDKLQSIIPRLN